MYSFSYLEPVCCSMSSSNCCFLTCIQISQEADRVVWYSYLLKNFPQYIVIHTVKGFGIVNKAEIDVFLELSCFFDDLVDIGNLVSGSSAFSSTSLNWKFTVHVLLKPGLENFEYYFTRPFIYDRNQIPYDYTMEVRNRFKGLDLIDRVPDELGMRFVTLYRRQGSRPTPWKRNAKKQNGCLGRPYK